VSVAKIAETENDDSEEEVAEE